jgi:glutaredoxin
VREKQPTEQGCSKKKELSTVKMEQKEIVLYSAKHSLKSWRLRRLLMRRGYHFEITSLTNEGLRTRLKQLRSSEYRQSVPYLFVDHRPVGGFGQIMALDGSGTLERLVRGEV